MAAASALAGGPRTTVPRVIVFPVVGSATYSDDFGAPRPQGSHEGNDIVAPRRAVAVAAETGKVTFHVTSANAGCMLYLYGDSGTTYIYIHLNNDVTDGNDNGGKCIAGVAFAPGLRDGQRVEAGDPVGFVGDSGDADGLQAHLHFEIHPGDGAATNPLGYLNRATRLLFSAPRGSVVTMSLTGSVVGASGGSLDVKVETAQLFPFGVTLAKPAKPLRLALPAAAILGSGTRGQAALAKQPVGSLIGKKVIVLTEPVASSLATESATPGAFSVSRLVLRSS
jgi:hypothetical protein